ncbi:MAG: TetR/AcrR family transcriptional regulator [Rhodoglobus sp.]
MVRIPSSERRALLIQAALRVIAQHGVSAATTRAIVAEADMSLASFHYVFRSHSEMMTELIQYVVAAQAAAVVAVVPSGADVRSALTAGFHAFLDYLIGDPGQEQVMQELLLYALRTPGLEQLARDQYDRYRSAVSALLTDVTPSTGAAWSIPVDEVARIVVTITDGVTLGWLADRDTEGARRTLAFGAEALARLVVTSPATEGTAS